VYFEVTSGQLWRRDTKTQPIRPKVRSKA
jgi:hypothetical protein